MKYSLTQIAYIETSIWDVFVSFNCFTFRNVAPIFLFSLQICLQLVSEHKKDGTANIQTRKEAQRKDSPLRKSFGGHLIQVAKHSNSSLGQHSIYHLIFFLAVVNRNKSCSFCFVNRK